MNRKLSYRWLVPLLFAVMAVSFAVVICLLHRQPGTLYREVFLHTRTDGDTTVYSGRRSGCAVVIRRTEQSGQTVVTFSVEGVFSQTCTVSTLPGVVLTTDGREFPRIEAAVGDTVVFCGGQSPTTPSLFCGEDGVLLHLTTQYAVNSGDIWSGYTPEVNDILLFSSTPPTVVRGDWRVYLCCLVASLFCGIGIAFPEQLFRFRHMAAKDPEPAESYLAVRRVLGYVLAVILLCFYLYAAVRVYI